MKYLFFSCFLLLNVKFYAQSNTGEVQAVQKTIEKLFDGMRMGDSAQVHSVFSDDVQMFSVFTNRKGNEKRKAGSLKSFLEGVGTPHDAVWDERISEIQIRVDDRLAQVWTVYQFYLGDKFSHCGVNSFQLVKEEGLWKIIYLIDTRRTKKCTEEN